MDDGSQSNPESPGDADSRDPMSPPEVACECFCLHCRRTFMSDGIWFQRVIGARDGFDGFWMCPTPNCSGAGFQFDIFPTDPNHPANEGWHSSDGTEEAEGEGGEWTEEDEWDETAADEESESDWDPAEPHFAARDEISTDDGDIEGEEWKYGVAPGETPKVEPPPPGVAPRNRLEEEALYNAPDRRPREVDWTGREEEKKDTEGLAGGGGFTEDDIPY